jgi:SNF2 family DNA or RNA helicase
MAPRWYQQEALRRWDESQKVLIALPPGAGKTAIGVCGLVPSVADASSRCLIVCPNGPVMGHWLSQLRIWHTPGSPLSTAVIGAGTAQQRADARELIADRAARVLIINYEAMRQDIGALLELGFAQVIFDESHRLKNRKSLTFKAAAQLARRASRVGLFTGTPIMNRADEMWTSLHLLNPAKYKSFWRWADEHFEVIPKNYRGRIVREVGDLKPGHVSQVARELDSIMYWRPMSEIMPELPELTETYLHVQLSSEERKEYDSMRDKWWMDHDGELIKAAHAASSQLRLRQLSSDWSAFGDTKALGTKAKAAIAAVDDLGDEKVLILCAFRRTVEVIADALNNPQKPYRAYRVHGDVMVRDRQLAITGWQDPDGPQVLVGTIATLGEGIDGLQVARNLIMVDRDWTPARNEQAIGRLFRSGQKSAVNVIHIVADDTVDEKVADALARKTDVIKAVVG